MPRFIRFAICTAISAGIISGIGHRSVSAQNCDDVNALLAQGNSVQRIIQLTGLTGRQIEDCRGARRPMVFSPQGPPPLGAAGPAPLGAAGPPPHGAAGPAPHGAAGPAPFGRQ